MNEITKILELATIAVCELTAILCILVGFTIHHIVKTNREDSNDLPR